MALFPVYEGGLRNLQNKLLNYDLDNVKGKLFDNGLRDILIQWGNRNCKEYDWHPGKGLHIETEVDFFTHLNPQCDVMNAARVFFNEVIYKESGKPQNGEINAFNRHMVVHLLNNNFDEPSNFVRIFLALTHLTFMESLYNENVPFFWDGVDDQDKQISQYIKLKMDKHFVSRRDTLESFNLTLYKRKK